MNAVALATRVAPARTGVVRIHMKLWDVLLLFALLHLERCEAYGSSQTSASQLGPDLEMFEAASERASRGLEPARSWSRKPDEVWVEIRVSSRNAPSPALMDKGSPDYNILTIAVRSKSSAVLSIELRLPERQLCEDADPRVCLGYEFAVAPGTRDSCDIQKWPYDKNIELPSSKLQVLDVQKLDLYDQCTVNNTFGQYANNPSTKRSRMLMTFKEEGQGGSPRPWMVFKIKVQNPPDTPITRPEARFLANTFQVLMRGPRGILGTRVLPAPQILPLWICGYTDWMMTQPCTARCGGGVRYAVRRLLHPPPEGYPVELLENCLGDLSKTHKCNEQPCDIDCVLGDWTPFADGPCSVTCGKGFQVQRRRVVEGPIGKGQLCPAFNELDVRVRYKDCYDTANFDCEPRCETAGEEEDGMIYSACNNVCERHKPTRKEQPLVVRKERQFKRLTDGNGSFQTHSCEPEAKQIPCGVHCNPVNFFPGGSGRLPRIGKWSEVVLVFFLFTSARGLMLEAPKGFDVGSTNVNGTEQCLLKYHNIPRVKRCTVTEGLPGDGNYQDANDLRKKMTFSFYNKVEELVDNNGKHQPQYEIRFYAKSPFSCPEGFNSRGACMVPANAWQWTLHAYDSDGPERSEELGKASFEVYNEYAKEWNNPDVEMKNIDWSHQGLVDATVTASMKNDILQGRDPREAQREAEVDKLEAEADAQFAGQASLYAKKRDAAQANTAFQS